MFWSKLWTDCFLNRVSFGGEILVPGRKKCCRGHNLGKYPPPPGSNDKEFGCINGIIYHLSDILQMTKVTN